MPYILQDDRKRLDRHVDEVVKTIQEKPFGDSLGDLNYLFSRILSGSMGKVSYQKIAMATGVLENIKQEFYRRIASDYEDQKIEENGDIKEYKVDAL